jgi:arylsulfatase A-like enzyme
MQDVRLKLNQPIERCRLFMVFDGRWKYIHASGFRPMLYDLEIDPDEFLDRGDDPECAGIIARLAGRAVRLGAAPERPHHDAARKIAAYADNQLQVKGGVLIGIWDEAELASIKDGIAQRAKL